MSELDKPEKTDRKPTGPDIVTDLDTQTESALRSIQPGLRERIRKLLNNVQQGGPGRRQELAKDRTRSLALLIGGTIGAARAALVDGAAANLAGGTHHAFADHGEGYCIFNDLVVTLRRLRAEGLAKLFLIIDLDVHQGNGTAALCEADTDVFTFSMHGENNYPVRKERSSWDIALPDATCDEQYLDILAQALPQMLERIRSRPSFMRSSIYNVVSVMISSLLAALEYRAVLRTSKRDL